MLFFFAFLVHNHLDSPPIIPTHTNGSKLRQCNPAFIKLFVCLFVCLPVQSCVYVATANLQLLLLT